MGLKLIIWSALSDGVRVGGNVGTDRARKTETNDVFKLDHELFVCLSPCPPFAQHYGWRLSPAGTQV